MSLRPPFELGLWNAWILTVLSLAASVVGRGLTSREAAAKFFSTPPYDRTEQIWLLIGVIGVYAAGGVYSIFAPLKLGSRWFYMGLAIWLLARVLDLTAHVSFVTTPLDEPVTKGLYRISRHPAYLASVLTNIGLGIASGSWVFLLLAIVYLATSTVWLPPEERGCLDRYGEAYREYMARTPRWIGIPKSPRE